MSKKISGAYTQNPNAGNDPTKDFKVPVGFGTETEDAYDREQLANAMSDALGLSQNIGTPSAYVITMPDNSLTYNIAPVTGVTYNYWIETTDDATTPTSGGTQGSIPAQGTISSTTAAETKRLWYSNDPVTIPPTDTNYTEILPANGISGIDVQYNDTLGPVWAATPVTISNITNTTFDIAITIPTDATGIDKYDILWSEDTPQSGQFIAQDVTLSASATTISGRTAGELLNIQVQATDSSGNSNVSLTDPLAVQLTTPSTGVFNLTDVNLEVNESGGASVTVTAERGGTGASTLDFTTVDRTALEATVATFLTSQAFTTEIIDTVAAHGFADGDPVTYAQNAQNNGGTNTEVLGGVIVDLKTYYASFQSSTTLKLYDTEDNALADTGAGVVNLTTSGAETQYLIGGTTGAYEPFSAESVTVGAGVSSVTLDIVINDLTSTFNNMFEIQLDPGSAHPIGTTDAILIKINGSGSGSDSTWVIEDQNTDGTAGTGVEMVVIDASDYDSLQDNGSGQNFAATTANNGYSDAGAIIASGANGFTDISTGVPLDVGLVQAPQANYEITIATAGDYAVWLRGAAGSSSNNSVWALWDGTDSFSVAAESLSFTPGPTALPNAEWYGDTHSGVVTLTAGVHTFSLAKREQSCYVDKIVLWLLSSEPLYDPFTIAAGVGPAIDTRTTSAVVDNPSNPTAPGIPVPSGTITAGQVVYTPLDTATDIPLDTSLKVVFTGMTDLSIDTFTATYTPVATPINLPGTRSDNGVDEANFTPNSTWPANEVITCTITGTVRDMDGIIDSINLTWTFTSLNAGVGAIIWSQDFSTVAQGTQGSIALLQTLFNANAADTGTGAWNPQLIDFVADPSGGPGTFMRIRHPAGQFGGVSFKIRFDAGNSGGQSYTNVVGASELWFSYDIYYSANHQWQAVHKQNRIIYGNLEDASHTGDNVPNITPEGYKATSQGVSLYNKSSFGTNNNTVQPGAFYYNYWYDSDPNSGPSGAPDAREAVASNTVAPTVKNSPLDGGKLKYAVDGKKEKVVQHVKLNDAPDVTYATASGYTHPLPGTISKNGQYDLWVDGVHCVSRTNRINRWTSKMVLDGIWINESYNNRPELTPAPTVDQFVYMGNFVVSTTALDP